MPKEIYIKDDPAFIEDELTKRDDPPPEGHNQPPDQLAPEFINKRLGHAYDNLVARADELETSCEGLPAEVNTDEMAGKVTDQGSMINAAIKAIEAARVAEKAPYLGGQRAVDGFFNPIKDRLGKMKSQCGTILGAYQRRIEAEERARLAAEAKAAREKAEREAAEAQAEADLNKAVESEVVAEKAEKAAEVKPAALSQTRGAYGRTSSLRTRWVGEVQDRNAIPMEKLRPYLSDDSIQKAVNAFVKADGRELAGVKIYEKKETVFR